MATRSKGKTSAGPFGDEDLFDSLLDAKKHPVRGKSARGGSLNRSSATDNIFSMLAEEVNRDEGDTGDSDVSAADPDAILKNLKDIDDMDTDLFASKKKPGSAPTQAKAFGNEGLKKDSTFASSVKPEGADEVTKGGKKPNSAPPSSTRNYKRFSFSDTAGEEGVGHTPFTEDVDDLLADLPDDLLPDETRTESKPGAGRAKPTPSPLASPAPKNETTAKKQGDITFEDDKDDLMDALGFESDKTNPKKKESVLWPSRGGGEQPQRVRTRLDEILENLPSSHPMDQPSTGEKKDQPSTNEKKDQPSTGEKKDQLPSQVKKQQENPSVKEPHLDDDLTFGCYQPTLGSAAEGRQPRRQSVRFSTEDVGASTPERKPTPSVRTRGSADWLGLKTNVERGSLEDDDRGIKTESPKAPSSPLLEGRPATSAPKMDADTSTLTAGVAKQTKPDVSKSHEKEEEDDDWLAGALSRRKTPAHSRQEHPGGLAPGGDQEASVSKPTTSQAPRSRDDAQAAAKEDGVALVGEPLGTRPVLPGGSNITRQAFSPQYSPVAVQHQVAPPQLLGLCDAVDVGALLRLKEREQQLEEHHALQAHIIQLEGQVKALQLERDQSRMLLESVQQRHKQDMELMEKAHKTRVKLLEESAAQREARMRQECEDLMERLAAITQAAEQERSGLQEQYQRKLAQAQQDRDREVERLRELQRKSILDMKKDHEDQVQRLRRLKEEEIDAVTSATSQTRSLTVLIEQMEQFSSRLGDLSSRVESTHEHTAQGLEQGARHRDEQLRIMQDRLTQQQKAMAEERSYLKQIIARMDTQINEQQRQLEKERWRMTEEQAKAESTLRGLEEERRALSMQISMEREELERAKSALLEEQKSVIQHCSEQRRKLAAEWSHFHAEKKQRHEWAEREVSSLLDKRDGSIISLAQDQADLKIRAAELKQREMIVAQDTEAVERLREELDREKERICSTGQRLQTRVQEVEAFSKLAAEKYEEGELALQEAKRVKAEHEARLRSIQTQTERLRQQEQRVLQERMRFNHLQKEAEHLRRDPPTSSLPQIISPAFPDSAVPNPDPTSTPSIPPSGQLTNSQSMLLQANLALWKYAAEKDRDYFQEELIFLDSLKRKSCRPSFNAD